MKLFVMVAVLTAGAPATADAPSTKTGTFGIGLLSWHDDGTDAAFDALRYFRGHPVAKDVYLADFPTDADWYVSGKIDGVVKTVFDASFNGWGDAMAYTVGAPIMGATFAITGVAIDEPVFTDIGLVMGGVGVLGMGVEYGLYAWSKASNTHVTGSLQGTFVLRRRGVKSLEITTSRIKVDDTFDADHEPLSRDALLAPLFADLARQIEQQMAAQPLNGAER